MPTKKLLGSLTVVVVAAFIILKSDFWRATSAPAPTRRQSGGSDVFALPKTSQSPALAPTSAQSAKSALKLKLANQVLYSEDVRAMYEKYKSVADPTGEIAYFLSNAIAECMPFIGKTAEQISASMNNGISKPPETPERAKLIRQLIDRCKGFIDWDARTRYAHYDELRRRAIAGGYPAAVAQSLADRIAREGTDVTDAIAISLLSGNVDDGVLKGIYDYLLRRNGNEWLDEQGNPFAVTAAWMLLECNMGADCGDRNHATVFACLYNAACEQHELFAVLPVIYPALNPERVQEAISLENVLGAAIEDRDWDRLGFSYLKKTPASTSK